jgi:hypothetical protein
MKIIAETLVRVRALNLAFLIHLLISQVMAGPVITSADHHVIPEGQTITLTGTGLNGASAARMFWGGFEFPATVTPVNNTTLGVVMPNVFQDIRDHLLLVETTGGSTFGIPSVFTNHTTVGAPTAFPPGVTTRVIVVRSGATLTGSILADLIYVETGGVYQAATGSSVRLIAAENGAYIDFQGVTSLSSCRFFKSPDTVVLGSNPSGVTQRQLTLIDASFGIGTFTVGYPINITTVGGGAVSRNPAQTYYRINSSVSLTATPDIGFTFNSWSGSANSSQNPLTVQVNNAPLNITATFSSGWVLDLINVPGVSVTQSPAGPTYADGTSVTLTATVQNGYEFLGWGGDLSGSETTRTFNITGNTTTVPMVRATGYGLLPQVTAADLYALPEGSTFTLTGTGLTGASAARLLWTAMEFPATVNPVNDTTLGVVMPDVFQDIRDHLLLVETSGGSTFGIPSVFVNHTGDGPLASGPPSSPKVIVVRAGATLSGVVVSDLVHVETGGLFKIGAGSSIRCIAAENGAVVDFRGVASLSSCRLFRSPDTVILGSIPTGTTPRQLTPIRASHGIGTFTVGYPVNITTVGGGVVSRNPAQTYYRINSSVSLAATPDVGYTFTSWSGSANSSENPLTVQVSNAPLNITATFSSGWILDLINVPGVSVTLSPAGPTYADGTSVTLTATVQNGYEFLGWGGDLSGSETTRTFNITGNTTTVPVVRATGYGLLPQVTAADLYALPEGSTFTLTGTGLTGASAARLLWTTMDFPATVNPVNDTTLGVVMPNVFQDIRDHLLLVETTGGSTFGIPSVFVNHTGDGPLASGPPSSPNVIVVRAGATLSGVVVADLVHVETGGLFKISAGSSIRFIAAENGAVVDFRGVTSLSSCRFFRSPDTVVLGSVPTGTTLRQLTPIRASHGIGTFTVGYPLNLTIQGPGTVSILPQKQYYRSNEQITLTATPNAGAYFIRWIGPLSGYSNPGTFSIRSSIPQVARFSTAPDFFTVWRLEHFTNAELADVTISAASADPDKDSLTNAAEYAFGSDPRAGGGNKSKIRVKRERVNGAFIFLASYTRPKNALDVTYSAQLSKDTINWTSNGDGTGTVYSQEISVEDIDADTEEVTLQLYPDSEVPKTFFVRINANIFD